MELRDLSDDELRVFVGLVREVVRADGDYSDGEKAFVAELSERIGAARFQAAMDEVRAQLPKRALLKDAAKRIERKEARQVMFDELIRLAAVDGVEEPEVKPLSWLASWWDIYE